MVDVPAVTNLAIYKGYLKPRRERSTVIAPMITPNSASATLSMSW